MTRESDNTGFYVDSHIPDQSKHPSLGQLTSVKLKSGNRSFREFVHVPIINEHTGEFRGNSFTFRTKYKKEGQWQLDKSKTSTLDNDEDIQKVLSLIFSVYGGNIPNIGGRFLVVPNTDADKEAEFNRAIRALSQNKKAGLLIQMLEQAARSQEFFERLTENVGRDKTVYSETAATLNLVRFQNDLDELKRLIEHYEDENDFQQFLKAHPWLFGSEYSELFKRRVFIRDSQFDFVVRRTSDGYIEIIEIKTPLRGRPLFSFDESRECYFPSRDLSMVIGQVQKYIEALDAGRYEIRFRDNEDVSKIRARVIIGRDVNEEQRAALRTLNGHLHRIEIITFDQLARIGDRMLSFINDLVPPQIAENNKPRRDQIERGPYDLDDDIPF